MKSKNLFTSTLFYLVVGMLIVSIYDSIHYGFAHSYVFYMFTLIFFLWYCYRKINEPAAGNQETEDKNSAKPGDAFRKGDKKESNNL